jgi:hypothetical protein
LSRRTHGGLCSASAAEALTPLEIETEEEPALTPEAAVVLARIIRAHLAHPPEVHGVDEPELETAPHLEGRSRT